MAKYFKSKKARKINVNAMRRSIVAAMDGAAKDMEKLFNQTQATWAHFVDFETEKDYPSGLNGVFSVTVATDDDQYKLVSRGSPPHYIYPVNAKQLVFPGTFRPKTTPGILKSGFGYSGPPTQYRDWVFHPGFEARKFDQTVRDAFEPKFEKRITKLMETLKNVSGYAL